ncbi:MAG: glycogen debranching enzyme family protein [Deltaproteobacteria bacterium]|nr:glycogen debranching enzyme family protein [Deltaproteobacteria bacterium]
MSINIKSGQCTDINQALKLEWLDTNGIGGYSSSTVTGCNTRKYHGLLVSRLNNPPGKFVLLSKYEESLFADNKETYLSTNIYSGGSLSNQGNRFITGFKQDKNPVAQFKTSHVSLTKKVAMIQGQDTVITSYYCTKNSNQSKLVIRPLLAYRDFHSLAKENVDLQVRTFPAKNGFKISPYNGMPDLFIQTTGKFKFYSAPNWYKNFNYLNEFDRGFDYVEDLFCPGIFEIELKKDDEILLSASTVEQDNISHTFNIEQASRSLFFKGLRGTQLQKSLKWSASQFLSSDNYGQKAVTAGFHWFLEWGRDAMIALPGLMQDNKNYDDYLNVLKSFAKNIHKGVIPNFLGIKKEQNAYNSVDAGLWFAHAVQNFLYTYKDYKALKDAGIIDALNEIFTSYSEGTINNIHMLDNGLLYAGDINSQLTWMDANSNGIPVTPRHGCAVEINALWYNFVSFMDELSKYESHEYSFKANELTSLIKDSFVRKFWVDELNCLADLYRDDFIDKSIRPNQIFAASLPYTPLDDFRASLVVKKVKEKLYTPLGLRSLSMDNPHFVPEYSGDSNNRDSAYHNGTVWPWLIGHFAEAMIKYSNFSKNEQLSILEEITEAFKKHIQNDGIGTVSEIFNGETPGNGKGCISQAWSVAEVLRVFKFYIQQKEEINKSQKGSKKK